MSVLIEDFVPYRRSVLWRIHDLYYARRGVEAWREAEIPARATNNAALARQYAKLALALPRAGDELTIVEIGGGSGSFAAAFMDALAEDFGDDGRRLYGRVRYVLSDFVPKTVTAAAALPAVRAHVERGRIIPAVYDLRTGEAPRPLTGGAHVERPGLVIANYLACVCATTYLRRDAHGVAELHARLSGPDDDDRTSTPGDPDRLVEAYRDQPSFALSGYQREYAWRATPGDGPFADPFHVRLLARVLDGDATVSYPFGFFDLLRRLGAWVRADGVIVMGDYGHPARAIAAGPREPRPRLYGDSLNHAIQFATLDAFAAEMGWDAPRTDGPLRSVQVAALAPGPMAREVARAFDAIFVQREDGADLLDFVASARSFAQRKQHKRAARFYRRALALDPRNAELHCELGECANAAGEPELAIEHLTRSASLAAGADLDPAFELGTACFALGRFHDAIEHYRRSVGAEPHPATWFNLALCHRALGDLGGTCQALDRALLLDADYEPAAQVAQELRDEWWRATAGASA